jgi:hypothetical protein
MESEGTKSKSARDTLASSLVACMNFAEDAKPAPVGIEFALKAFALQVRLT